MSNFQELLNKYNNGLKYYVVVPSDKVIGEDGKYVEGEFVGYAIENTETGVIEHTNICLAAIMFQANHFDDMLASLLDGTPALTLVDTPTDETIVPTDIN